MRKALMACFSGSHTLLDFIALKCNRFLGRENGKRFFFDCRLGDMECL